MCATSLQLFIYMYELNIWWTLIDTYANVHTPAFCSNHWILPPPPSSPSNWAVSGVQVEAIWIPSGRDHCGSLWHSRTSHFQTICNIFLPSVTLIPQSLCHLDTPEQFVVKNTSADMQDQMEGGINIVINSVESACCMIHNVLHIRLARGAVQFMF